MGTRKRRIGRVRQDRVPELQIARPDAARLRNSDDGGESFFAPGGVDCRDAPQGFLKSPVLAMELVSWRPPSGPSAGRPPARADGQSVGQASVHPHGPGRGTRPGPAPLASGREGRAAQPRPRPRLGALRPSSCALAPGRHRAGLSRRASSTSPRCRGWGRAWSGP